MSTDLKEIETRPVPSQAANWQSELRRSYRSIPDLVNAGIISAEEQHFYESNGSGYQIQVTPYYASLMTSSAECPIRKQALPQTQEVDPDLPESIQQISRQIYQRSFPWRSDAIGDLGHLATSRLTHRYPRRAILHLSHLCAVYCRFCFRKEHLNSQEEALYKGTLENAFSYLLQHNEISELILTGGDPLSLGDNQLQKILERISSIRHIKVLRIHSRMAVTLPCRLTSELGQLLGREWGFQIYLVSHFNHPVEVSPQAAAALKTLKTRGVGLLNQSVLLRGINDKLSTLVELFERLYQAGVLPYYLHHPDWTPGTFHFRVSIEQGLETISNLRRSGFLTGPAIPDYILDIPSGFGKISVSPSSTKLKEKLPHFESHGKKIQASVYEIQSPTTRLHPSQLHSYLDMSFLE